MQHETLLRRTFLKKTLVAFFAFHLPWKSQSANVVRNEVLVYATKIDQKYFINSYDLKKKNHFKIEVPFRIHSVSNIGPQTYLLIEKKGPHCCIVDFKLKKISHIVKDTKTDPFYGHFEIDEKAKKLYAPQRKDGLNHIFIRSLDSLDKISDSIYKTEKEIHMISIFEPGRLAICIDDKNSPSVDVLNLETQEVVRYPIEKGYFRPGHLANTSKGNFFITGVIGDDYDGAGLAHYNYKKVEYFEKAVLLKTRPIFWIQSLNKHNVSCGVSPDSNLVLLLSNTSRKILKKIEIKEPYGVDILDDQFVVIGPRGLTFLTAKDLVKKKEASYPDMNHLIEDFHPIISKYY